LIAKTVNQDDPGVYHLFYGSETAQPGSELTFFEYPGAKPGRDGAGMVHRIVSRVAWPEALDFWERRLSEEGIAVEREDQRLRFADPEGLGHELAAGPHDEEALVAEHPEVPAEFALQGFAGVRAYSDDPALSRALLERVMDATAIGDTTWELRGERRASTISFDPAPAEPGRQSAGSVHHVAWGTTAAEHPRWLDHLRESGVSSTPIIDRHYFHSIYFREPNGVLFEIADDAPGFTVDGPVEQLGSRLILPPFLEGRREQIEAQLTPLPDPRAGWAKTSN
jgi:glyoxalase family protein